MFCRVKFFSHKEQEPRRGGVCTQWTRTNAPWLAFLACLPCLSLPSLPFQCAATSRGNRAPVPSWAICASCDLSAYAYTPSGRSPAQLAASWLRFARLTTPVVAALGNSGGVVPGARVHRSAPCAAVGRSRPVHRQSAAVCFVAQFRGGCRYIAASRILPAPCRARSAPRPPSRTPPCSSPLPLVTTSLGEPNPYFCVILPRPTATPSIFEGELLPCAPPNRTGLPILSLYPVNRQPVIMRKRGRGLKRRA